MTTGFQGLAEYPSYYTEYNRNHSENNSDSSENSTTNYDLAFEDLFNNGSNSEHIICNEQQNGTNITHEISEVTANTLYPTRHRVIIEIDCPILTEFVVTQHTRFPANNNYFNNSIVYLRGKDTLTPNKFSVGNSDFKVTKIPVEDNSIILTKIEAENILLQLDQNQKLIKNLIEKISSLEQYAN